MADKTFVIYSILSGTATARPVMQFFNEDETFVPDLPSLGYAPTEVAWLMRDPFLVSDTLDDATGRAFTVNPSTGAITETSYTRGDVATDQLEVSRQIAQILEEYRWTQELDAKITKASQEAFAAWIEQLKAIPTDPLWATNPKGITIPAAPAVVSSAQTVGRQVAAAVWTDDTAVASQKLNIANWGTLQPVWGFDTDDLEIFHSAPGTTKSWAVGRSGPRALQVNDPGGAVAQMPVRARIPYSFAMGAGDTFFIEAYVRGTTGVVVNVGLAGFNSNAPDATWYDGGDGRSDITLDAGVFKRVSGYVQVPSGTPIRWGSAELYYGRLPGASWLQIDSLTVTRVPRLPNTNSQANDTVPIVYTGSDFTQADVLLGVSFFRGGNGATVKLNTSLRIVPQNTASDQMRLQFWLVRQIFGSATQEAMVTWLEYGNGAQQHRNTMMEWTDPTPDNKRVDYTLRASKLGSVSTMSVAHRSLSAILLPRL